MLNRMKKAANACKSATDVKGCVAAVAAWVVVPLLLAAANPAEDGHESRRRTIAEMSPAGRKKLERDFRIYQEFPEDRRKRCHDIHAAVKADPELHSLLYAYHEWLKELSPYQREELRKQTDPKARVELVRQFRVEQERDRGLSPKDLAAVMKVIEDRVKIPEERREKLDSLTGLERHVFVLSTAFQTARHRVSGSKMQGWPRWPTPELANEIIDAISSQALREWLRSVQLEENGASRPMPGVTEAMRVEEKRRRVVFGLIVRGLQDERQAEFEQHRPTDEELREFFAEFDDKDKTEIVRLPPDEAQHELMRRYFAKHHKAERPFLDSSEARSVMGLIAPWMRRGGQGGGPGGGSRQGLRNGPRPPFGEGNESGSRFGDRSRSDSQRKRSLPRSGPGAGGRRPDDR